MIEKITSICVTSALSEKALVAFYHKDINSKP